MVVVVVVVVVVVLDSCIVVFGTCYLVWGGIHKLAFPRTTLVPGEQVIQHDQAS